VYQVGQSIDGTVTNGYSGWSVASSASGSRVVIGGIIGGIYSDSVAVYDLIGTDWIQVGSDIVPTGAPTDRFGVAVAMSGTGDRIAIGENYCCDSTQIGRVHIYDWDGTTWTKPAAADIDGETNGDRSGSRIFLSDSGLRIAIGAGNNDGINPLDSGHVRVYDWSGGVEWVQVGQDIDGEAGGDQSGELGVAMSASGTRIAIGAGHNDGNGANSGHVRVYDLNGANWEQVGQDINGEAAGDLFGQTVAMSASGTRIVIGATNNDGNGGANSGHVRVYDWTGASWDQLGQDIDGKAPGDLSGHMVAMSADGLRIIIAAPASGTYSGQVRIYDWNGADWVQFDVDIVGGQAQEYFGTSVAIAADGSRIFVGASFHDVNGFTNAGTVKAYNVCTSC
jgi:FG-GAP repeat